MHAYAYALCMCVHIGNCIYVRECMYYIRVFGIWESRSQGYKWASSPQARTASTRCFSVFVRADGPLLPYSAPDGYAGIIIFFLGVVNAGHFACNLLASSMALYESRI